MKAALVVALLACSPAVAVAEWPTLRQELAKHGIDASRLEDADRQITSYAVRAESDWFAIAYYWYGGSDLLPPELRIRTLERASGSWRFRILHANDRTGGSAVGIQRVRGVIYLDLHLTPSAGELIALSEDLRVRRRLSGWSSLLMPDGRMLYENSMTHFAPAHPGSVSLYDPEADRDVRVYPAQPERLVRLRWMDRSISKVVQAGPDRVRILAREQPVLIGQDNRAVPDGPAREIDVSCDISRARPVCRVRTR